MSIEIIKVPDLGDAEGVDVIEICVAVGDQIEKEDSLIVLETDKASMEIPSPAAGKVVAIKVSNGDTVSAGDVIVELETDAAEQPTAETSEAKTEPAAQPQEASSTAEAPSSAPVVSSAGGTAVESIKVPSIGGAEAVDIIEVCVSVGDEINEGDSLIVLETDKASMEIPSPKAGKVVSVSIKEGDTTSEGAEIVQLEVALTTSDAAVSEQAAPEKTTADAEVAETKTKTESTSTPTAPLQPQSDTSQATEGVSRKDAAYAGPAVRKLARELGVDVVKVSGSGPKGRVTKDDLKDFVKTTLTKGVSAAGGSGIPVVPAVDFSQFGEVSLEPLSKIHKLTAENMHRSWLNVPHVTQFDDANISELEDFRQTLKAEAERRGVKITPLPFLLKACAAALREQPKFNASLHEDGAQMVYKKYIHIGVAVDTPQGLMVPVIRDVDKKSIWELAAESAELAQKAKDRKLSAADMQGGCFTISSLGGIGGLGFTPIVNTPEVGILGVSRLTVKPLWNGKEFVPAKMLPLSLSYDHRAINGGDAGRFLTYLTEVLADIRRLVL
ncbi:MAG: dihydrolipoyllysine-residue acetyltransferase [Spongiibacteraceae bacterium]